MKYSITKDLKSAEIDGKVKRISKISEKIQQRIKKNKTDEALELGEELAKVAEEVKRVLRELDRAHGENTEWED